jgi:hypothetical protein
MVEQQEALEKQIEEVAEGEALTASKMSVVKP